MLLKSLLDFIMPRTCCLCGRRLTVQENLFCTACGLHLPYTNFINNPYENDMAKAFWGRIKHIEKAYAPIYHLPHSESAKPIYQLKYFHKPELGIDIGAMMGKEMSEHGFFEDIDCIIPVPLAKERLRERGYNQSDMIAQGLQEISHLPIIKDAVRRVSFNSSQTRKNRIERNKNVENSFELTNGEKIKGKHILIVDDIVTTGATVSALAIQLEQAEGVKISIATIGYAGEWQFTEK